MHVVVVLLASLAWAVAGCGGEPPAPDAAVGTDAFVEPDAPEAPLDAGPCSPDLSLRATRTRIVAGSWHTCALLGSGEVACWGRNDSRQLGFDAPEASALARRVPGVAGCEEALSTGDVHGCVSRGIGVRCWGARLGDFGYQAEPYTIEPVVHLGQVRGLASGSRFACALNRDGAACWGAGYAGQLGSNDERDESIDAVVVSGADGTGRIEGLIGIDAGLDHACGLASSGEVLCWGSNQLGRAVPGGDEEILRPARIAGLTAVTQVSAGGSSTCALRSDDTVVCWGGNGRGQLGRGTTTTSEAADIVPGISGATSIEVGGSHACAVVPDGIVCWGSNDSGQIGDGTVSHRPDPTPVRPPMGMATWPPVLGLAAGALHTCALTANDVFCWGDGQHRQVGAETDRLEPGVVAFEP